MDEILGFLDAWERALHPEIDGRPVIRYALLHPRRVPLTRRRVEGVPPELVAEWEAETEEDEEERETLLRERVTRHGGRVVDTPSRAEQLAMIRRGDGGYRVYELDADGNPTEFTTDYATLDDALRACALAHGHPPNTLCWRELPWA